MEQLQRLLNEIRILTDINQKMRKEKLAKGEAFNLFSELGMSTDEVHLHSAFLAMLLNPKSNHGQIQEPFCQTVRADVLSCLIWCNNNFVFLQ